MCDKYITLEPCLTDVPFERPTWVDLGLLLHVHTVKIPVDGYEFCLDHIRTFDTSFMEFNE